MLTVRRDHPEIYVDGYYGEGRNSNNRYIRCSVTGKKLFLCLQILLLSKITEISLRKIKFWRDRILDAWSSSVYISVQRFRLAVFFVIVAVGLSSTRCICSFKEEIHPYTCVRTIATSLPSIYDVFRSLEALKIF